MIRYICGYTAFLLLDLTTIYANGCSSGWYGPTAYTENSKGFMKKSKSEIIKKLGVPDASFSKEGGLEYWLYTSNHYRYFIGGEERRKRPSVRVQE